MDVKIERPLLPLRDIVVFPNMVIPLFVGRDKSIAALNEVMKKDKKISSETISSIKELKDASKIADNIASHLTATISEKQQIFETIDVKKRLNSIIKIMENETSIIGVEKRIRGRVKTQMEKTQREYYLN